MSINVNPPPQLKLPKAFLKDPEIREYFRQHDRFDLQLWTRTGAGDDLISGAGDAAGVPLAANARISQLTNRIDELSTQLSSSNNAALIQRIEELEAQASRSVPNREEIIISPIPVASLIERIEELEARSSAPTIAIEQSEDTRYLPHIAALRSEIQSSGAGDFVGPASATDNAFVRFNATTGKLGQDSNVICDDSDNITGVESLAINSAATTTTILNVQATAVTTGTALLVDSNSADTNNRDLIFVRNDNTLATGARGINIKQDSVADGLKVNSTDTGKSVFLDTDGNGISLDIDSEATTANIINVSSPVTTTGRILNLENAAALTSGRMCHISSNSTDATARELIYVNNSSSSATGAIPFYIQQDAALQCMTLDQNAASSFIDFQGAASANASNPISTLTTSGSVTHHVRFEINGVTFWIPGSTTNPT